MGGGLFIQCYFHTVNMTKMKVKFFFLKFKKGRLAHADFGFNFIALKCFTIIEDFLKIYCYLGVFRMTKTASTLLMV